MALLIVAMLPLLRLIVGRPEEVGQLALGAATRATPAARRSRRRRASASVYWCAATGTGACCWPPSLLTCGGVVVVSHLVPYATDRGIPAASAALLLSVNGVFSMAGALLFGHVADRIGARTTLGLIGLVQATCWSRTGLRGPLRAVRAVAGRHRALRRRHPHRLQRAAECRLRSRRVRQRAGAGDAADAALHFRGRSARRLDLRQHRAATSSPSRSRSPPSSPRPWSTWWSTASGPAPS